MSRRLEDLAPEVRVKVESVVTDHRFAKRPLMVVHTLRTSAEQALAYAKGRERPGEPCNHRGVLRPVGTCEDHPLGATVTNAKPGSSWHEYGRATDFAFIVKGKPSWAAKLPWHLIGEAAALHGLEWGIKLKNGQRGDLGHVQDRGGMTLAQARALRDEGAQLA